MVERTDEDKLVQSPVMVKFGGEDYPIPPLPIKYSLPWCRKAVKVLMGVIPLTDVSSDDADFGDAFAGIMVERPEQLIDLLFEYARGLNREEIEEVATSSEIVVAFEGVMQIESPLFGMALRAFQAATPEADLQKILNTLSPNGISPLSK